MKKTNTLRSEPNRAAAYVNEKAKGVVANLGMYLMLALDILFLVLMLLVGTYTGFVVAVVAALVFEVGAVLTLLPVPFLQVGVVTKNIAYAIVFALMPVLELIYGISVAGFGMGLAVFGIFTAARVVLWATAFFFARLGAGGGAGVLIGIIFVIFPLAAAGAAFEFPLTERPLRFAYRAATEYYDEGYVVTGIAYGIRDNVRIPETYRGKPVVGIEVDTVADGYMRRLTLPESVTYVSLQSSSLRDLTVQAPNAVVEKVHSEMLESISFPSDKALPAKLPATMYGDPLYAVHRDLFREAMARDDFAWLRDRIVPVADENEGYIVYHTDCSAEEGGVAQSLADYAVVTRSGEEVWVPEPDLTEDGFVFLGWFDSRAYTKQVKLVKDGERVRLYAKYLRRYTVDLYEDEAAYLRGDDPEETLAYHYESDPLVLPSRQRDGYAFCGWFPVDVSAVKGANIGQIPTGSRDNRAFYGMYQEEYNITYHTDGGTVTQALPETYHAWSESVRFLAGSVSKSGYAFLGWYRDAEFTQPVNEISPDMRGDIDIYFKFNFLYTATLHPSGGTAQWLARQYHSESGTIELPIPTRKGYVFNGWYKTADFTGESIESFTGADCRADWDAYAKWTPVTYTVKYRLSETSNVYVTGPRFTYDGDDNTLDECTFFENDGYEFTGWKIGETIYRPNERITANLAATQDAEVVATAQWQGFSIILRYVSQRDSDSGTTEAKGEMADQTIRYGNTFTTPECAFTREGYVFESWVIHGSVYYPGYYHMAPQVTEPDTILTVTANWKPITYTVRFVAQIDETVQTFWQKATFDKEIIMPACSLERDGYEFLGWKIDGDERLYRAGESVKRNFASVQGEEVTATAQWRKTEEN